MIFSTFSDAEMRKKIGILQYIQEKVINDNQHYSAKKGEHLFVL